MELILANKLQRLDACQKIRNIAAQTCLRILQHVISSPHKVSEIKFRNDWLKEMERSYPKGFISCWYDPPPGGIAVIINDGDNVSRVNYTNLRVKQYWPRSDIYFKSNSLGYLFASPYAIVDNIPIIGDFGFTFYRGNSPKIKNHFKKCYLLLSKLIGEIKPGMTFKQIYINAQKNISASGLKNEVVAFTDKTGTDFGHTIPFIDRNPDTNETDLFSSGDPDKINSAVSHARIFINETEVYRVGENCAFTFEPRFTDIKDENLPMCSFHTIVQFVGGEKKVLGNFNGLFNLLGMDWLKN